MSVLPTLLIAWVVVDLIIVSGLVAIARHRGPVVGSGRRPTTRRSRRHAQHLGRDLQ